MIERSYHLSDTGREQVKEDDPAEILADIPGLAIFDHFDYGSLRQFLHLQDEVSKSELVEAVYHSDFYTQLTEDERLEFARSFRALEHGDEWSVEHVFQTEGFFELPTFTRRIESTAEDYAVLLGSIALDLYRREAGRTWLENWRENGFKSRLDAAVFATARLFEVEDQVRMYRNGESYSYISESGIQKTVMVTADMSGDFHLVEWEYFPQGSITPSGQHVEFAPSPQEIDLGAHHSVEPQILQQIMHHFFVQGAERQNIYNLFQRVLERMSLKDARLGYYGDAGNSEDEIKRKCMSLRLQIGHWQRRYQDHFLGEESLGDIFTGLESRMIMASAPGGIRFHNTYDHYGNSELIFIRNEDIELFLLALFEQTRRGLGRTGPHIMHAMTETFIECI